MYQPEELRNIRPLMWSPGTGREVWAMLCAARDGDLATIKDLTARKPELIRCHYGYRTPMYFAVRSNRLAVARFLIERDRNPFRLQYKGALTEVARRRGYGEMLALLEETLRRNGGVDGFGNRPVHLAAMRRDLAALTELAAAGTDLNAQRPDGATPMQLANGDYHFRGWRDVPPEVKTTPQDVRLHLKALGAEVDLCTACYMGDMERVKEIVGADLDAANRPSEYISYYACSGTPLRNAALGGHLEIVKFLLEAGADPNGAEEGIAPLGHALHAAACQGHIEIVKLLLSYGAHPNVPVESSADTLSAALHAGNDAMVELLCRHGAARSVELLAYYGDLRTAAAVFDANPAKSDDVNALRCAAEEGHEAFVHLMLRYQPELALRTSPIAKTKAIHDLLVRYGMDVNRADWMGTTPLHQLARRGDVQRAEWFLDDGAELERVDDDLGTTPLGCAMDAGRQEMIELLVARGAKPLAASRCV